MSDTIIESVLSGNLDNALLIKWLNNESIEDAPDDCILFCCTKSEFVVYFLSYLRSQTDSILQTNSNAAQILQNATPEKLLSTRRKHHRSISEPTSDEHTDSLAVKSDSRSHHESPNRDKKRTGRRVKTKLFTEDKNNTNISVSSDESKLSTGVDRLSISSTPLKNGFKPTDFPISSPVTPRSFVKDSYERCDTPRLTHRHSRSHEKSCLGDYLITATKSSKKKPKKNSSNDSEIEKVDLDLSNSEVFPEIGARKSSSLRSEQKRIKPTNISTSLIKSQKSLSLNSFNSECFQQSSPLALEDNSAFKHQKFQPKESTNSFEVERSLLKQERHKLMEKFNILNTSAPAKTSVMPQIKITQKESIEITQNYIKADVTKILMKEKIETLIEIYDLLLTNNLILSINMEIYFLISVLMSKQLEDEYLNVECKLKENDTDFLLKSIHNSTYFAVKSLWNQKIILEVILDKNSLKTLGENKKVRSFYPELAKFLLNWYCVRCESPAARAPRRTPAVVNYNCETDSVDNFPTTQAFHLFKKQRDAFYDIVRWYSESSGGTRTSFRARVKTLLSHSATAANHKHLASLFVAHMVASNLPTDAQESKLCKLQRRLTCPNATESNRLPHFTSSEMFYKEFILHAENESFRVHLRDALATELVALDTTLIAVEDRSNSNNLDITREYLQLAKKLVLLAKFLGFLTSLPYSQVPTEVTSKTNNNAIVYNRDLNYTAPKEKVLANSIALRNYSQPTIDLKALLNDANDNSRLSITLPWLVHYLSMLDYTTLRLRYYSELIRNIFDIYYNKLKLNQIDFKKNTVIYLKSILGWLFDLEHFPADDFRSLTIKDGLNSVAKLNSDGVDVCELIDESTIVELCPWLKEVNTLLATCRLSQDQKDIGSFRHITPVSLSVNPEDRIKNKEKELQARLEEELLKSQPSSTRRVLEMVVERVTSAVVKEISARELVAARDRAREQARRALAANVGESHAVLLQTTTAIYNTQVCALRTSAACAYRAALVSRARAALCALLPAAPPHIHAVAARLAAQALATWLRDHTATPTILCKDIEAEMRTLISMNEMNAVLPSQETSCDASAISAPEELFTAKHCSVAQPLIQLKEHICLVLDGEDPPDVTSLLSTCALSCSSANIFCRSPSQRAVLQLSIDLCLLYVSRKPQEITESFLDKLHAIWNNCCPDRKHHTPEEISLPERRASISPQFRNFEDDERVATPVSDDEGTNSKIIINGEPSNGIDSQTIASTSQPIVPTSQPITPKWQPININLQPINARSYGVYAKSQPASPMLQPINTKWNQTSKSQPVSPKLQPIIPTSQLIFPKLQFVTVKSQPVTPKSQPMTPKSQLMTSKSQSENSEVKEPSGESDLLECFERILCPRNIVLLSASKCNKSEVWETLATVLVFLLKNDYLSEDSLTEQCLAVYRQDWPQSILESLSTCMQSVSSRWSRSSAGKFTLFLDFLAEYCGDMDYEPIE